MTRPLTAPAGAAATQVGALPTPFDCSIVPEPPFVKNAVVLAADWYGILPTTPPLRFVAIPALSTKVTIPAVVIVIVAVEPIPVAVTESPTNLRIL